MASNNRMAKKRTLQKAGFVAVTGWLPADEAKSVLAQIEAAKQRVADALSSKDTQ